ncbi:MAG: hypothetical protein ACM3PY_05595 [Omnitrophica WOR_2 bacterium]
MMGKINKVLRSRKRIETRDLPAGRICYILLLVVLMFTPLWSVDVQASSTRSAVAADLQPVTPEKPQIPFFTLNTYCTPSLDNIGEVYCEAEAIGAPESANLVYTWIWNGIKQAETGKVLHLTGIPEGDYEVQVQAFDPKSGIRAKITSMKFQVQTVIQNDSILELPRTVQGWMELAVIPAFIFMLFMLVTASFLIWRRRKRTG